MKACEYVWENVPERCNLDSALIEWAALERDLEVRRVDRSTVFVGIAGASVPFIGVHGPDSSSVARWIGSWLDVQRSLAHEQALPSVRYAAFAATDLGNALRFAVEIGWPVIIRRADLRREHDRADPIHAPQQFRQAWSAAASEIRSRARRTIPLIVEECPTGRRFQVFIVDDQMVSATHIVPAGVVGDGHSSVESLIEQKNRARARNPFLRDRPIPTDALRLKDVAESRHDVSHVPALGEWVAIERFPSEAADIVDVTASIGAGIVELARRAVEMIPGLPYGTVEIVSTDQGANRLDVVRYEAPPLAAFPTHGQPRDTAGAIVDHYVTNSQWRAAQANIHRSVATGRPII